MILGAEGSLNSAFCLTFLVTSARWLSSISPIPSILFLESIMVKCLLQKPCSFVLILMSGSIMDAPSMISISSLCNLRYSLQNGHPQDLSSLHLSNSSLTGIVKICSKKYSFLEAIQGDFSVITPLKKTVGYAKIIINIIFQQYYTPCFSLFQGG